MKINIIMIFRIQFCMWKIFKLVFLFVGVVIGAGFATGSEIVLYFEKTGLSAVLFSAFLMGVLAVVFCYFGKIKNRCKIANNLMKIVVFFSSIVTYCVMISGSEEIVFSAFGVKYFGLITGLIVAVLMLYDMKIIKLLNVIIVPCIVLIMAGILAKSGGVWTGGFDVDKSVKYAGMNMLLGGYFMAEEGEGLSHKQILMCGGLVFASMSSLMVVCYLICTQATIAPMPLFEVAKMHGLLWASGIVIYLAIFTTLIGSGRAVADFMLAFDCKKILIFAFFALLTMQFFFLPFDKLVHFCYGKIGEIGMIVCIIVVCSTAFAYIKKKMRNN